MTSGAEGEAPDGMAEDDEDADTWRDVAEVQTEEPNKTQQTFGERTQLILRTWDF